MTDKLVESADRPSPTDFGAARVRKVSQNVRMASRRSSESFLRVTAISARTLFDSCPCPRYKGKGEVSSLFVKVPGRGRCTRAGLIPQREDFLRRDHYYKRMSAEAHQRHRG